MSKWIISLLTSSATTLLVAFFGAFIGAVLALWKSKKEKIWQEKYHAYQEILGSINDMKYWAVETNASCQSLPTVGSVNEKELYKGYANARKCISKYINIGKLIISNSVTEKLDELNRLMEEEDFQFEDQGVDDSNYNEVLYEHTVNIQKIIDDRLDTIIHLAKKDLKYRNFPWPF
jgi:hypothetical protein